VCREAGGATASRSARRIQAAAGERGAAAAAAVVMAAALAWLHSQSAVGLFAAAHCRSTWRIQTAAGDAPAAAVNSDQHDSHSTTCRLVCSVQLQISQAHPSCSRWADCHRISRLKQQSEPYLTIAAPVTYVEMLLNCQTAK
jgi:hypothetical protein